MRARNKAEEIVLQMVQRGERLHGWALEILTEMTQREDLEAFIEQEESEE